ncbi:MAG: hypothetical protein ABJD68_05795, partial [Nakamurella sp.]
TCMRWSDSTGQFSIEKRSGGFPGLPVERSLTAVLVSAETGIGTEPPGGEATLSYWGEKIDVRMNRNTSA